MKNITIALAGNPNSGKTTIFNKLTGARQHVGNYPGVTVEKKEGFIRYKEYEIKVVDLPGIYTLTAYSIDEVVARNFIIDEKPDLIVNIIDSSNLERNLYLTVQLKEMGIPMILVFNMSDESRARGYRFDIEKFSRFFNAPIVETVGNRGLGIYDLLEKIIALASQRHAFNNTYDIHYGTELESEIENIRMILESKPSLDRRYDLRWLSIKLLENDSDIIKKVNPLDIKKEVERSIHNIQRLTGEMPETIIAEKRYGFISGLCQKAVHSTIEIRHTISDKIDRFVTNRLLGIPIFLCLMYLVFSLTFRFGEIPIGLIEDFFKFLGNTIETRLSSESDNMLKSLFIDGILGGTGNVLVFLPNILFLFFAISILEDSGYMARAAFIMDRLMNKIGLQGKSFIPMLIGFGCSVPAILATRTLENKKDRLTTMLVIPLMSCGARLPIYTLIISAFFPKNLQGPMLWSIYVIGIIIAIFIAKILQTTIFKGEPVPFIMELPPYRIPTLRTTFIHMWHRGWLYLKKAGTIILGISVIMWAISFFPELSKEEIDYFENKIQSVKSSIKDEKEQLKRLTAIENEKKEKKLSSSIAGSIGRTIEPALKPMGFDWKIGTALMGAFAAKEVFVAQLGIVYFVGDKEEVSDTLREKLKEKYSPLVGFCVMLFCLISMPCMSTVTITAKESGSWKWAVFQLLGLTIIAYIITTIVFQIGNFLGIGMN